MIIWRWLKEVTSIAFRFGWASPNCREWQQNGSRALISNHDGDETTNRDPSERLLPGLANGFIKRVNRWSFDSAASLSIADTLLFTLYFYSQLDFFLSPIRSGPRRINQKKDIFYSSAIFQHNNLANANLERNRFHNDKRAHTAIPKPITKILAFTPFDLSIATEANGWPEESLLLNADRKPFFFLLIPIWM